MERTIITLLQPTYGATLPRLPESDPMMRMVEQKTKNKHIGLGNVTGGATVSTDALVESAMVTDAAYGLLSTQLTLAAGRYEETAHLLLEPYAMMVDPGTGKEREQQQTDMMS